MKRVLFVILYALCSNVIALSVNTYLQNKCFIASKFGSPYNGFLYVLESSPRIDSIYDYNLKEITSRRVYKNGKIFTDDDARIKNINVIDDTVTVLDSFNNVTRHEIINGLVKVKIQQSFYSKYYNYDDDTLTAITIFSMMPNKRYYDTLILWNDSIKDIEDSSYWYKGIIDSNVCVTFTNKYIWNEQYIDYESVNDSLMLRFYISYPTNQTTSKRIEFKFQNKSIKTKYDLNGRIRIKRKWHNKQ